MGGRKTPAAHGASAIVCSRQALARLGMKAPSDEINRGLAYIRRMRRIVLSIIFSFLPFVALTMACIEHSGNWLALLLPVSVFFVGLFIQHQLHKSDARIAGWCYIGEKADCTCESHFYA